LAADATSSTGPATPGLAENANSASANTGSDEETPIGFWERDTLTGNWHGVRTKLDACVTLGLLDHARSGVTWPAGCPRAMESCKAIRANLRSMASTTR
jgi:hypothetical protein